MYLLYLDVSRCILMYLDVYPSSTLTLTLKLDLAVSDRRAAVGARCPDRDPSMWHKIVHVFALEPILKLFFEALLGLCLVPLHSVLFVHQLVHNSIQPSASRVVTVCQDSTGIPRAGLPHRDAARLGRADRARDGPGRLRAGRAAPERSACA